MLGNLLNLEARRENARALALAAGLSEDEASARLEATVLVTHNPAEPADAALVAELVPILSRTIDVTYHRANLTSRCTAELVVGSAVPRSVMKKIFVIITAERLMIRTTQMSTGSASSPHPLMIVIAACYVAGAMIGAAVGDGISNLPSPDMDIPFDAFISPQVDLASPIQLGETHLAGAGAIGNGVLWAGRHVPIVGRLSIVDDDVVSPGNLQRQIWFGLNDIDKPKAEQLAKLAQPYFPQCSLVPVVCRLQEHPSRNEGPWLKRLIVAVDSRRARRHLQNELPGEVFDASTTGSQEIVLHHNKQPNEHACLGCVYPRDEAEVTHEQAIADHLGIDIAAIRAERISPGAARQICATHSQLNPATIEGLAFDTLYKQLCGSAQLKSISGKQVVAPFAFVSLLAGALLLLEIIRRTKENDSLAASNEWRVNPWRPPVPLMRYLRARRNDCECCFPDLIRGVNERLWGSCATV